MLIYGTCNPEGYGNETYEGLYLTDSDIRSITPSMPGVPVKIEHRGSDVGKVVSAWVHEGRMDVLMEIDGSMLEGEMGREFVRRGICPELSLGYNVTMSKSPAGFYKATNKRVVELSIVRQGARDGCKIRAFADSCGSIGQSRKGGEGKGGKTAATAAATTAAAVQATQSSSTPTGSLSALGPGTFAKQRHRILI